MTMIKICIIMLGIGNLILLMITVGLHARIERLEDPDWILCQIISKFVDGSVRVNISRCDPDQEEQKEEDHETDL